MNLKEVAFNKIDLFNLKNSIMERNITSNALTKDSVTAELLHQPKFRRTVLLLYLVVPANYIVKFINKETSLIRNEDEKVASKAFIDEVSENRRKGASKDELKKVKEKHLINWEVDHPGNDKHLSSAFKFCVYDSPGTGAHLQDFKFLLPDSEHDVRVSINKSINSDKNLKALEDLLQDFIVK